MPLYLLIPFIALEILYLGSLIVTLWFYTMPVNLVTPAGPNYRPTPSALPKIVLFYPVLRELEETMRTTFTGMARADYPAERLRVIAIPNADDEQSVDALQRLSAEFDFLEVMPVPPTTDPSWGPVWDAWDANPKAYWWHEGKRAGVRALPPKKTRQLIWSMYQVAPGNDDTLLSYIDADSVIPADYWYTAAKATQRYDVVQNTNITGNLLATWPASFYAMDHIAWDASMYKHMSADGRHPFYVLGKGLFFRFRDLIEVGGFHPWLTIEDPEIGMRLWTNGRRLGVVESPLVEEVPATWSQGVTQRKRWVAGFFQSLASPLKLMGMKPMQRLRARLNFVPCLSLAINPIGLPVGAVALTYIASQGTDEVPAWVVGLGSATTVLAVALMLYSWHRAWVCTARVLPDRGDRLRYFLRVNPIFVILYWLWWTIPLVIGFVMFVRDHGLTWERTEKRDANHELIRSRA